MNRPKIIHMVEAFEKVGGPPALVRQIIGSRLREKYDFAVISYEITGISPAAILRLRGQLIRQKPDLVHIHGLKADGLHAALAAKLARVPKVLVTVHGSTADAIADYQTLAMRLRRWIVVNILEPASLSMADSVYCVCDAMTNRPRIQKYAGARLKNTIHNGIPSVPLSERSPSLRKVFGFSEDDIVLLYTGRIGKDKGLEVLAAAMVQVAASVSPHEKIRLLLVGDGREFYAIRACFQPLIETGVVCMPGRRDDIAALNIMSDIFIFPSLHENLAFSLLEAMDAGLPIIASAVGGNVEVVVNGSTGVLVPPNDADSLARAITKLTTDPELRLRMGEAGRLRLRHEFNLETMIRKTDQLYEQSLPL